MKRYIIRFLGSFCAVFGFANYSFGASPDVNQGFAKGVNGVVGFCHYGAEYMYYTTGFWTYYVGWPNSEYTGSATIWLESVAFNDGFFDSVDSFPGAFGDFLFPLSIYSFRYDDNFRDACVFPSSGVLNNMSGTYALSCLRSNEVADAEALYSPYSSTFSKYNCCLYTATGSGSSGYDTSNCPCFYVLADTVYSFTGIDTSTGETQIVKIPRYDYSFINCRAGYYQPSASSVAPADNDYPYFSILAVPGVYGAEKVSGCVFPVSSYSYVHNNAWCANTGCTESASYTLGYMKGACQACPSGVSDTNLTDSSLQPVFNRATVSITGAGDLSVTGTLSNINGLTVAQSTVGISSCYLGYMYRNDGKGEIQYSCNDSYDE